MKTLTLRAWLAVAAGLWAGVAAAGTGSAFLNVNITLRSANANANALVPGVSGGLQAPIARSSACTSETLNEKIDAMVRVVCATSQFVNIAPSPGKPFLGTHGGAFRYTLGTGAIGGNATAAGGSTVTGLRIYNAYGSGGPLEMLVSF